MRNNMTTKQAFENVVAACERMVGSKAEHITVELALKHLQEHLGFDVLKIQPVVANGTKQKTRSQREAPTVS